MASPSYVTPTQQRHLRACMVCSLVQVQSKFLKEGCPNCEEFLLLANSPEAVEECTSQVYEGLVALADPAASWVAKWSRLDGFVPGVYALKVVGVLPRDIQRKMEEDGVRYLPRDGSGNVDD